jgi:glutamate dehydrogenase
MESVQVITSHILSLYGSKIMSFAKNSNSLEIQLERESDDGAVFMHTSKPGISQTNGPQIEKR